MRRIFEGLRWRLRHATVQLLLPGLVLVVAALLGQALNVAGANVPALTAGPARWGALGLGVLLLWLALVVGVPLPPPVRRNDVRGAWGPMPPTYVPRPELEERLRQALLGDAGERSRRVGVWGMGGTGKSVLVAAVGRETAVSRRFSDGMVWVRLDPPAGDAAARSKSLPQKQYELAAKLATDGTAGPIADVQEGRDRLAELLRGRTCLLVVDNVWTPEDVHAFDVLDCRGALVLTTRDAGLVRGAGAVEVAVERLTQEQAHAVAASRAGVAVESLPTAATRAFELVGNLALGVATLAADARADGRRWAELAERLEVADLAAIRVQFPDYPYPTLLAALHLSLDHLPVSVRERYRELAVFAGRGPVPRSALEALWTPRGLSAAAVGDLLVTFEDRAMLSRDPVTERITLHDLQYDVARASLGSAIPAANRQLISGYAARCPRGWPSGPDDGYFFQHLIEHLAAAGLHEELTGLLVDVEWMRSQLAVGGVPGLLGDYALVPDDPDLDLVEGVVRLSAHVLAGGGDQLPSQLTGRTIGRDEPVLARLHDAALRWPHTAWLQPLWPTLAQPGHALRQALTGHIGAVRGVAVSADGKTVVSGGEDGTVRVWASDGTAATQVLAGHTGRVLSVASSADGATVVSGGADGTVRVWTPDGTAAPRVLAGHTGLVRGVAVSADGLTVVSGGEDGTVRVWARDSTAASRVLTGRPSLVRAVAVSADGTTVVSGSWDGTVRLWDSRANRAQVLARHSGPVLGVAVSADGATVVSGGVDGALRLWHSSAPDVRVLSSSLGMVRAVAVSADGTEVVSGGGDGTVRAWGPDVAEPRELFGHAGWVYGVAVSPDGMTGVSGGRDGTVRVWALTDTPAPRRQAGHTRPVWGVGLSADGKTVVSGGRDDTVRMWAPDGTGARVLPGHSGWVRAVAVSANGMMVVSGGRDATVKVWGPNDSTTAPRVLSGHIHPVWAVAVSADGTTIVSGSWDGTVRVWEPDGAVSRELAGRAGPILGVGVSADGTTVVSGGRDGTVRLWGPDSHDARELRAHAGPVLGVAVSADGATVVSGGEDGTVRVWARDGAALRVFSGHVGPVRAVAISAEGTTAVSGGRDGSVRVWDLARGRQTARWIADAPMLAVALAASTMVAGDAAGQVHALRLRTPAAARGDGTGDSSRLGRLDR